MLKKLTTVFLSLFLFLNLIPKTHADFSDLFAQHENYTAIIALKNLGILEGYADGTFRPDQPVNRAEFLKIIMEGSSIPLDAIAPTGFSDVADTDWHAPYIKKAFEEGWIMGYGDSTFRPAQTIINSEALKILGEVQNWELKIVNEDPYPDVSATQWYAPYVDYAKSKNYLPPDMLLFFPKKNMNRAEISEIIYQTLEGYAPIAREEETKDLLDFKMINHDFFDNATLSADFPNTFYKNEIYYFSGQLTSPQNTTTTILLQNAASPEKKEFYGKAENGQFSIPVFFSKPGLYHIGIITGESGESIAAEIAINSHLPQSTQSQSGPQITNSLSIKYENTETFATLPTTENAIKKLVFTQDDKTTTYISRQNIDRLNLNYKDFASFSEKTVTATLYLANASSLFPLSPSSNFLENASKTFTATTHTYSFVNTDSIDFSPINAMTDPQLISITGKTVVSTQKTAYITKPDGFVEELELKSSAPPATYYGQNIITENQPFTFDYTPKTQGTYIIEINDKEGIALINHPVYIGRIIPLIPDFFDLNQRKFFSGTFNLTNLRNELLSEINKSRQAHGLNPITLSAELNTLAQLHSDNMAQNEFFSHIDPEGLSPEDRRLALNIKTPVSENIARDVSIRFAHEGLMRSGAHRINIINENWEQVGLGISQYNDYLVITQEFSTFELSKEDLLEKKSLLLSKIDTLRTTNSLSPFSSEEKMDAAAADLNEIAISTGTITKSDLTEILQKYEIFGTTQALGRTHSSWSEIENSILKDPNLLSANLNKIGIDITLDSAGKINLIVILNQS